LDVDGMLMRADIRGGDHLSITRGTPRDLFGSNGSITDRSNPSDQSPPFEPPCSGG
jgi:hypothetical protein